MLLSHLSRGQQRIAACRASLLQCVLCENGGSEPQSESKLLDLWKYSSQIHLISTGISNFFFFFFFGTDFDFTRLNYWYFELRRSHGTAQSFLPESLFAVNVIQGDCRSLTKSVVTPLIGSLSQDWILINLCLTGWTLGISYIFSPPSKSMRYGPAIIFLDFKLDNSLLNSSFLVDFHQP